jgi:hypothetical protein
MVAYAAVQVAIHHLRPWPNHSNLATNPQTYLGLSSLPSWGPTDGTFNLIRFYHLIVKTLSDDTDEWVTQTLSWWKR